MEVKTLPRLISRLTQRLVSTAKYKEYNKSKTAARAPSTSVHPSSTTSDASTSTARPQPALPSNIFKTPTKPKAAKRTSAAAVSPSKSATGAHGEPTYVIANSPSKLRALAAAHSSFGSPNRPSSGGVAPGGSGGRNGVDSRRDDSLPVVGSPKKYNPFAAGNSSVKKGLFDQEVKRTEKKGKELGRGRTKEGAGWGSSEATRGWESMFASGAPRASSSSSRRMEEDEEQLDATMEEDYAAMVDEALGPSPVKPVAGKRKEFKPLFQTTTAPFSAPPMPPPPPKPFTTEFSGLRKPTSSLGASQTSSSSTHRGVKRAPDTSIETEKAAAFSSEDDDEDEYAGKGAKAKRKKGAAAAKGKGKATATKGKGKSRGKNVMNADEYAARTLAGEALVLDMEVGEEGDEVDRVTILPRGHQYKPARRREKDPNAMEEDEEGAEEEEDEEDYSNSQGASLFYRDSADLLTTSQRSLTPPHSDIEADDINSPHPRSRQQDPTTSHLPSELASILSLRSSPIKKTSQKREKERDSRVNDLLTEPGRKKVVKGLMDLAEAAGSEGEEEVVEGSDDDWASDAEGWKDLGEGEMDGYDEAW